jgi:streptomycin 6-kinase
MQMPRYTFETPRRMHQLILDEPLAPQWIERLPAIVEACMTRWGLVPGRPFDDSYASLTLPVTLSNGKEAVLKINIPNPESAQEHTALQHWDGAGAVRLLDFWPEHQALLLERCVPGVQLWRLSRMRPLAGHKRFLGHTTRPAERTTAG